MRMKRILALLVLVFTLSMMSSTSTAAGNSELQIVTYTPDFKTIFANPERGFYNRMEGFP